MSKIHVINSGTCNIGSVVNMLNYLGIKNFIVNEKKDLNNVDKIILPGVGSFDHNVKNLHDLEFFHTIKDLVEIKKIPILGICLGMHLFCKTSEEGNQKGFGFFDAEVIKFKFDNNTKQLLVPHMGWNSVRIKKKNKLLIEPNYNYRFYFVHSYHVKCSRDADVMLTTNYGYNFHSGINKEHIYGVQFHPEKSHRFGMEVLKNFSIV